MPRPEANKKKIESLTLKYGAALVKTVLPVMSDDLWEYYTIAQKVFFLYLIAERYARRDVANGRYSTGEGLNPITPGLIKEAMKTMEALPKTI